MTKSAPRPVRPIGRVRVGTPVLLGIAVLVTAPVTVAYGAAGGFGRYEDHQQPGVVALAGPVTAVEVTGFDGDVYLDGSATATGVTGTSLTSYHETATRAVLTETVQDGVAKLAFTCPNGHCSGGVSWHLTVPAGAAVTVTTNDALISLDALAGPVTATSDNGDVRARELGSGDAVLRTRNAAVTAQFDGAPTSVSASSENGDVDITTDGRTPAYDDVRDTDGGGSVDLSNPGNDDKSAAHVITVRTSDGRISIR